MKCSIVLKSNGASSITKSAGYIPGTTGKLGRMKFGEPPSADVKFDTSAKCVISSSATPSTTRRQRSITASCSSVTPSETSRLSPSAAYRYKHIRLCSSSAASPRDENNCTRDSMTMCEGSVTAASPYRSVCADYDEERS